MLGSPRLLLREHDRKSTSNPAPISIVSGAENPVGPSLKPQTRTPRPFDSIQRLRRTGRGTGANMTARSSGDAAARHEEFTFRGFRMSGISNGLARTLPKLEFRSLADHDPRADRNSIVKVNHVIVDEAEAAG